MSSLVKLTALSGARSEQPLCYLLEIDEACILLDCGWDETFDVALLRRLIKIAPSIDAVLLTHCDLNHLGALPYIFSKGNMRAKVYATLPVQKMGQLAMYDVFQSRSAKEDFTTFSLADIDNAWDNFVQLRYQQPCTLSGKAEGITVSPLNAGHQIGGALWKITKESEEIVYAVDYNHAQDRHLDGTVLVDLPRPNILITDAYTALDKPLAGGKKAREHALLERVRISVEQGGNVLLPVDSTGRVLELLIVLDECWQRNNLRHVTLAFLSPESRSTVDMAASQTEWLSKHVNQRFVNSRQNVFALPHVHRCTSISQLRRLPYPQVVLASGLDLESSSFALDLFAEWVADHRNQVILTQKARPGCLARRLYDAVAANRPIPTQAVVLQMFERVPLEGRELLEHQERERLAALEAQQKLEDDEDDDEQDEGAPDADMADLTAADAAATATGGERGTGDTAMGEGEATAATPRAAETPRGGGGAGMWGAAKRQKTAKTQARRAEGRFLLFPHKEDMYQFDEYGEVCDTSVFLKADQDLEIEGATTETINFSGVATSEGPVKAEDIIDKPQTDVPTKSISKVVKVHIRCPVSFVDFGGRSDGASAHTILEHLKPSKVIIVHAAEEATEALRNFCIQKVTEPDSTLAPPVGEAVLASSDTNIYKIKLDSALAQALQFVRVGAFDVAYLDAVIDCSEEAAPDKAKKGTWQEDKNKELPVLKLRQGVEPTGSSGKPFAFIGDVKLSDLKLLLDSNKYKTELKAGMLVVNGQIIIRKSGHRMVFEGQICRELHAVRKLLLSQYHTL